MGTASRPESALSGMTRKHVLSALETAHTRAEREYEEVEAERRAYAQFKERVSGINTGPTSPAQSMTAVCSVETSGRHSAERVRSAFGATVMNVDHYDELYGESLDEHVAAELSPEIATLFQPEQTTAFTEPAKTVLIAAVDRAVSQRDVVLDTIEREQIHLRTVILRSLISSIRMVNRGWPTGTGLKSKKSWTPSREHDKRHSKIGHRQHEQVVTTSVNISTGILSGPTRS